MPSISEQARQLPIYACEADILAALAGHRVIVVEGPTGSGKTTQIPRMLRRALDPSTALRTGPSTLQSSDPATAQRPGARRIGVTQPRRIAAVSVAWRIAAEEGVELGDEVGYAIRFDDQTSERTAIKVMTDGILLMEARSDPDLRSYDVLMIDEAHERSLNIDVILGLVHQLLARRDDLKVIVSSATIHPEQFQRFFAPVAGEVPLVSVPARTYPIEVVHRPPPHEGSDELIEAMITEILRLHRQRQPGHILAFLTGAGDIRRVEAALHERSSGTDMEVLPLYARLTRDEQERVFDDFGGRRKIVLATNIAETSITIPDVRYVVDCGLAKVPRFSPRTAVTTLREEPISRASAEQRAGRAGRTGPGVAIRLYSKESLAARPELTEEEILRLDLSEVVLRLIDLGVRDIESFPFPAPPPPHKVRAALGTLTALGAIDQNRELTTIGRRMVPFPLEPRLARMVIEAAERFPRVADDVLVVGAFISSRSPFILPEGEVEAAREAHHRFFHPLGDAVAHVQLYRAWRRSRNPERFCAENYLDPEALAFAEKAHKQLADIAREQGVTLREGGPREEIVRCIAAGFVEQLIRRRGHSYVTQAGVFVRLHPSSVLAEEPPGLAVAIELVEHARPYAINVSALKREWLQGLGARAVSQPERRGARGLEAPAAKPQEGPASVSWGGLELAVSYGRGKASIDLSLEQVQALRSAAAPPADARLIRGRVHWDERHAFAGILLPKLATLIRLEAFPRPGLRPPTDIALGQLLESDRDRHGVEHALATVMRPGVLGRSAGWIAFVANGAGGYWLDVVPHYRDALLASRLSIEGLIEELYEGDPLRERAAAVVRELEEKASQLGP